MPRLTIDQTHEAPTVTAARLLDELGEREDMLQRVELEYRAGAAKGKFRKSKYTFPVSESESARDVFREMLRTCTETDQQCGEPCWYRATYYLRTGTAGKEKVTADDVRTVFTISEQLEELAGDADDPSDHGVDRSGARMVRGLQGIIDRQYAMLEKDFELIRKQNEALAANTAASTERLRIELEHKREVKKEELELERDKEDLGFIRDIAPMFLATRMAKQAREEEAERGAEKKATWRHLQKIAATVLQRDSVRAALGEAGVDIFDAFAHVNKREQAEELITAFQHLAADKRIDVWYLLTVAPELAPVFDVLLPRPDVAM